MVQAQWNSSCSLSGTKLGLQTAADSFSSKAFYVLKCLSFIGRMSYLGGLLLPRGT
jgi:hypothetical protein